MSGNHHRRHHILFTQNTWESQDTTRALRRLPQLIVPLHDDEHNALHQAISTIPLLDHNTARRVQKDYLPIRDDYIGSMFSLMSCISDAIRHPRVGEIERGLAQLAVHAVELQLPFIREGML